MTQPLFIYPPNWNAGVAESLEWLTDVQTAHDGSELRRVARLSPRRSISYSTVLQMEKVRALESFLWRHQTEDVRVPVWTDGHVFTSSGDSDTVFSFDLIPIPGADLRDYRIGGQVILLHGDGTTSVRTVTSIGEDNVTFTGSTVAWSAGDKVYPLRVARLPSSMDTSRITAGVVEVPVVVRFVDDTSLEGDEWPEKYRGVPVLDWRPNRSSPVAASLDRITATLDYLVGKYRRFDKAGRPFVSRVHEYVIQDRDDAYALRSLLYALKGRYRTFWCPNWQADLAIVADIGASDTTIDVGAVGYEDAYLEKEGRQDIMIRTRSGDVYYRRITAVQTLGSGVERLTIDSALGDAVGVADVAQVCWLDIVRLASDDVTFQWLTARVAQVDLAVRGGPYLQRPPRAFVGGSWDASAAYSATISAIRVVSGAQSASSASTWSATGLRVLRGSRTLSAQSSQTFSGQVRCAGALSVSASSSVSPIDASRLVFADLNAAGNSSLSASGSRVAFGAAALNATATSSLDSLVRRNVFLPVLSAASSSTLTGDVRKAPEPMIPIQILDFNNLSGPVTRLQDDPDNPDANWLTAVDDGSSTEVRVAMSQPSFNPSGAQTVKTLVRPAGKSQNNPTLTLALWVNGSAVATLRISSVFTETVFTNTFLSSEIPTNGAGVEFRILGTQSAADSFGLRSTLEVGAIRWIASQV